MEDFQSFSFSINGLLTQARYANEDIDALFLPLIAALRKRQREKGKRLIVFLAAPPGTGKSTLASFLAFLSQADGGCPIEALGLDGFHYHQDYILSHQAKDFAGNLRPMKEIKGSPETFDISRFREKLLALQAGDPPWPVYDRNLHDVAEDKLFPSAPIILLEGNWLLLREKGWEELSSLADLSVFIKARENFLRERLISRKMQGGLSRKEAEAFYQTGDGPNVRRVLSNSREASLILSLSENGRFSVLKGKELLCAGKAPGENPPVF